MRRKRNIIRQQNRLHILAAAMIVSFCLLGGGTAAGNIQKTVNVRGDAVWESEMLTEMMTDMETESEVGIVTDVQTEFMAEGDTERPTEPTTEGDTEKPMEGDTEESTKLTTEGDTEEPTEITTEGDMEELTEITAEGDTEEPTEITAEGDTEEPTEITAEGDTEEPTEITAEGDTENSTESTTDEDTEMLTEGMSAQETESAAGALEKADTELVTDICIATETQRQTETVTEEYTRKEMEQQTELRSEMPQETATESTKEQQTELITEAAPEEIFRGIHYEIKGDSKACYRDSNDRLWVRRGSALQIGILDGSDYNKGASISDIQSDGILEFRLQKCDAKGNILKESAYAAETYMVDGEAPGAVVTISGNIEEGIAYASMEAAVQILVEPDAKSGLKSASYCIVPCGTDGSWLTKPEDCSWQNCSSGQVVTLQEEGVFQVYVRTEDRVGNIGFANSIPVCVDQTGPEVKISGVEDQSANSGSVMISVDCRDANYRNGSLKVTITGINRGKTPMPRTSEENADGAVVQYHDFPEDQAYDDMYCMSVSAEDKAGNRTDTELQFSVNRYGSVYDLSAETKEKLKQYYLSEAADIVFLETNIDYIGEAQIFCRRDGVLQTLVRGTDYQVEMQGEENSWKQYRYMVPASYFDAEGVYELLLSSGDLASNTSDTGIQEKRVVFALDWTPPACTLSGISSGERYSEEVVTAYITPYDNVGLGTVRIYHDSQLLLEKTESVEMEQPLHVPLKEAGTWQTLQVYVRDLAGNEYWSQEVPFYINKSDEAPPYEKTRLSAQESEQRKEQEELTETAMRTASGTADGAMRSTSDLIEGTAQSEEQEEIPMMTRDDSGSSGSPEYIRQNPIMRFLWPVGTAFFLFAAVICIKAGNKRDT